MTDSNERLAALETNMGYVLGVLAKREEYQASVLRSLTIIEMKQDQGLDYQKTCDAERTAQGVRISGLEDARKAEFAGRRMIKLWAAFIGGVAGFLAAVAAVYATLRH